MLRRYAKAGVLILALVVLVVEGYLVYQWYERYYVSDAVPEATSGGAPASEETTATGDVPSDAEATLFAHTATDENSRGDYTYIADPAVDGDPDAVVLVMSSEDAGGADYGHNIGVWYDSADRKRWAIFNQDRAAVPSGATFRVVLPPASEGFVHRAGLLNTVGNTTYLDDPLTNAKPGAIVSVTQNWNPGGGAGVYNDHPVGVFYDEDAEEWAVYNRDGAPLPDGAAFNVATRDDDVEGGR